MAEKKFFVDINLQGNKLVNPVVGSNSSMTAEGSFQYNAGRLEYYNGSTVQEVANLNDIAAVTGGLILQGGYDAATNTPDIAADSSVLKGFFWVVTAAGSFLGEAVQVGDSIIAKQDNPGATAANWLILQGNVVIATDSVDGIVRLATQAEANDGTEGGAVVITPATLQGKIDAQITPEINNKLPLAGGTMSGTLDMDNNQIDSAIIVSSRLDTDLWANNNKITDLATPTDGGDAANKTYVDDNTSNKLPLAGGTMSGNIDMDSNEINNLNAVRTDELSNRAGTSLLGFDGDNITFASGRFTYLQAPVDGRDAANKTYVDGQVATSLPLAGGTMSGNIDMDGNYLDGVSQIVVGTITNTGADPIEVENKLNANSGITNLPAPINGADATNKTYVDDQDALKLSLTGGTMSGDIIMGGYAVQDVAIVNGLLGGAFNANNQPIINVPAPINSDDATNKGYVDNAASTAESNANDYTDTAISQEVTDRNNAIKAQSFSATILSEDWLFDNTINSWYAVVTHNLGAYITVSSFYDGAPAEFTGELSGNDYYLRSNIQPVESTVINIIKAGGNL